MHTGFWWENQIERYHYEDVHVDAITILKWVVEE
jgi:hypothetical protein